MRLFESVIIKFHDTTLLYLPCEKEIKGNVNYFIKFQTLENILRS